MPAAFPGAIGDGADGADADGADADADAEGDGPRGAWLVAESAPSLFSNARLRTGGPPRGLPVSSLTGRRKFGDNQYLRPFGKLQFNVSSCVIVFRFQS